MLSSTREPAESESRKSEDWTQFIQQACKDTDGRARRNVYKMIVRALVNRVQTHAKVYIVYLKKFYTNAEKHIENCQAACTAIKTHEREDGVTKDYIYILNKIANCLPFHLVLYKVLEELLEEFAQHSFGRIKQKNVEVYKDTVAKIHSCSLRFLQSRISHFP